jgi:hypothetical protein
LDKLKKMQRFLPGLYKPQTNEGVRGLLFAWAEEDDIILEQITEAKRQLFVLYSQLQYLDALGSNVGVFRPTAFNLSDELYRRLIPALSYHPKQVMPTIKEVLGIFFGENNPEVKTAEVNPNEIVIEIPSAVPALRRDLVGSHHFHAYNGLITSIDNISKSMVIDISEDSKSLQASELAEAYIGQNLNQVLILDNGVGNTGVTLQFDAGADLSVFNTTDKFVVVGVKNYPGSFFKDTSLPYNVRSLRGILGQNVVAGEIITALTMQEASNIPNEEGYLIFNLSKTNEEAMIKYIGRPNNSTLLLDPVYSFLQDHVIGEPINVLHVPKVAPDIDGSDYGIYTVGVTAARILAQQIIQSIVASGVVIRWVVKEPIC